MFMRMIYDEKLAQAAYLIGCQKSGEAIVIDPERDVDRYINLATENGLRITAVAETHIHADFLSGARELAEQASAKVYVSDEGDADWKYQWLNQRSGGGAYDHQLLHDGDTFHVGKIEFKVVHTPGHTPEHLSYMIIDHGSGATEPIGMATGDFVFVGDLGRPDLLETAAGQSGAMKPSAIQLFKTVHKLDKIADFVQVWPAHGAGSACGKALGAVPSSTIGYEKRFNPAIRAADSEAGFVDFILAGQPEPPLYFARMKRDNKVGPRVLNGLPKPKQLNADDLKRLDGRKVAIIDTRSWDQYRAGHVPGAMWFPLNRSFNTDAGSFVDETEDICLIIASDKVEEAVRDLVRIGLDRVTSWYDAAKVADYSNAGGKLEPLVEITTTEAQPLLQRGVPVLDVRRATEFSEGHIPTAVNIAHTRLASRMNDVPQGKQLIVNCRSGARSGRACAYLQRRGYDVMNLKGGILAWEKAGAPIDH